jgi:soluble cytochrome b562
MAKKKKVAGADIDWYLISIERLKQIGLVLLLLILGGVGWWYWSHQTGNPRSAAEAAIADARDALNSLAASKDFAGHRSEFDRAQKRLDEANSLLGAGRFVDAQSAAVESQTISRSALSGGGERESDAQFLTIEGDVQYQKSSTSDWKRAEPRTALFNGDWVKTSDNSSAELIFSNLSRYTVGPNALLEIYAQFNPATSKKSNSVQMKVGSVEVATTDDASTVRTPVSQIVVDSESQTQVGVQKDQATAVVTTKGTSSVTSTAGGEAVKLSSGEKVVASPQATLSPVKKVSPPPALTTPADNQIFSAGETKVDFVWEAVPGATAYILQVSRSRLFSSLEINSKRQKTTASARLTGEGAFYWRVASVGPDGDPGPFSAFRRFRATGTGRETGTAASSQAPPPPLSLKRPYPIGGPFYMIEGTTEPGATVLINDEEVDVESNGHFKKLVSFNKVGRNVVVVKAINSAGKQTVQSETVLVEE